MFYILFSEVLVTGEMMEDGEIHDQLPVEGTIYIYRYIVCTCTLSLALFSLLDYQLYGIINASRTT